MEMSYCRSCFEVNDVDSKPLDVDWLALNDVVQMIWGTSHFVFKSRYNESSYSNVTGVGRGICVLGNIYGNDCTFFAELTRYATNTKARIDRYITINTWYSTFPEKPRRPEWLTFRSVIFGEVVSSRMKVCQLLSTHKDVMSKSILLRLAKRAYVEGIVRLERHVFFPSSKTK